MTTPNDDQAKPDSTESERRDGVGLGARNCSPDQAALKAKMRGATDALEGRKLGANPFEENDDRHFQWLKGCTGAKMEMIAIRHKPTPDARLAMFKNRGIHTNQ